MSNRLSIGEIATLLDPAAHRRLPVAMRCDLVELLYAGWATVFTTSAQDVFDLRLLEPPAGEPRPPPHVAELHARLRAHSFEGGLMGGFRDHEMDSQLAKAIDALLGGRPYAEIVIEPLLIQKKLAQTPAGAQFAQSLARRIERVAERLPHLLAADPGQAVAFACGLGVAYAAAANSVRYAAIMWQHLAPLSDAIAATRDRPFVLPFELAPRADETAWRQFGPAPIYPEGLARLIGAITKLYMLNYTTPGFAGSHRYF